MLFFMRYFISGNNIDPHQFSIYFLINLNCKVIWCFVKNWFFCYIYSVWIAFFIVYFYIFTFKSGDVQGIKREEVKKKIESLQLILNPILNNEDTIAFIEVKQSQVFEYKLRMNSWDISSLNHFS